MESFTNYNVFVSLRKNLPTTDEHELLGDIGIIFTLNPINILFNHELTLINKEYYSLFSDFLLNL
jgi:hypothetical protein